MITELLNKQSTNDDGVSPGPTPYPGFSEMFDALAPSPEHPLFSAGHVGAWSVSGSSASHEAVAFHDMATTSNASFAPWQPSRDDRCQSLSHVSSASSLSSMYSCAGSLANTSMDSWTMPVHLPGSLPMAHQLGMPSLQLETQGLGKAGRSRSNSRAQPYQKERPLYLPETEEYEELGALPSACSPQTPNPIVNGLGRLTLHHRSSHTSLAQRSSPMRSSISRTFRSGSITQHSASISDAEITGLTGTAEERESVVRTNLGDQAQRLIALAPGTIQDKERTRWVRRWLQLCYSVNNGSTVPRQGLYNSYSLSCEEFGVRPINSASFGKAVKAAFPGIKTRRLGHRGNSKYHYVSLRPSIRIEAMRLNEFGDSSGQWHVAPEDGTMGFHPQQGVEMEEEDVEDTEIEDDDVHSSYKHSSLSVDIRGTPRPIIAMNRRHTTTAIPFSSTSQAVPVYTLPGFPSFSDVDIGQYNSSASAFWQSFCQHLDLLAGYMRSLRFDQFEFACRTFWAQRSPIDMDVCQHPVVSSRIDAAVAKSYDHYLTILVDRLHTPISTAAQCELRKLAQNLESIMEQSTQNFSSEFCEPKIELAVRAGHFMLRFADLYQVSAALSPILSNSEQVQTMLRAWDKLDKRSVADQCALSFDCKPDTLAKVMSSFRGWLSETAAAPSRGKLAIEKLGIWLQEMLENMQNKGVVSKMLMPRVGFITSQVVRDFETLRSDTAFGLFQLIKTWIDDWASLHMLRHLALSNHNFDSPPPAISVVIPKRPLGAYGPDLSTAVPTSYVHAQGVSPHTSFQASGKHRGTELDPSQFLLATAIGGGT